ncbi:MAG: hypothetical protein ACRD3J_14280 [Thermoanaerobaculia bacterium]
MFAAACLMVVMACGSAPTQTVGVIGRNRNVILAPEIESYRTSGMTAYDIVAHLRPEYLKNRGISNFSQSAPLTATVYVNGAAYGDIDTLKSFDAGIVTEIRYLSASDATTRFGTDHTAGAILVSTR